jgi:hypothetical protein
MGLFDKIFRGSKKTPPPAPLNTDFIASYSLMDEDQFWKIIQATKNIAHNDFHQQQDELAKEMHKLSPGEIIQFANSFRHFRGEANTWELWGAIYIINGGCGDDSFNDFREWVIGQGKDFYYRTIKNPETLSEIDADQFEDVDWEGLGYIPGAVFQELTGQEMPYPYHEKLETTGVEWKEGSDDLEKMFPKLAAKYPDHI